VSLTIPEGAFVALVGPNGAGKSTLLRCLMGYERVSAGSINIMGVDPGRHRDAAIRKIGYVGQSASLYADLSVAAHLDLAAALRKSFDRAASLRRLTDLGIDPARRTHELSGGQRAQVAITLAIGTKAPILLLDEPLASIDPLARRDVIGLISEVVRSEGVTVVLASHIVGELEGACDRIVVLAPAKVVLNEEIAVARHRHRVVALGAANPIDMIGTFSHPDGNARALIHGGDGGTPATLDEIVLGYLAAARTSETRVPR
jgi:ABC-2 type transport system ATP-binding protein